MSTEDLAQLADYADLFTSICAMRAADVDDAERLARVAGLQARIEQRRSEQDLTSAVLERDLGCSPTESLVVWALACAAVRPRLHADILRATGETAMTLHALGTFIHGDALSAAAFRELGPRGMLRRLRIIERQNHPGTPEDNDGWRISGRVLALLYGEREIDESLRALVRANAQLDRGDLAVQPTAAAAAAQAACATFPRVIVASGTIGSGRRTLLQAHLRSVGRGCLAIEGPRLAHDATSLRAQLATIARECRLLGRVPLLCNIDALVDDKDTSRLDLVGSELVPLIDGPVLVTCGVNRPKLDWGRPVIVVEMGQPTTAQRAELWHQALGQGTREDAELLATRYPLAPALIVRAAEAAKARAHGRKLEPDDIYAGIRAVLDDRLGQFAKRVTVTQTWDDLVLPEEQVDAIVELMARIRERRRVYEEWGFAAKVGKGLGVSALFSGPPGTGKTMVAALIARDLGLELYQVDVSKIVSKYIGETEKNLAALFDAAEAGHAVLLFDEADALFGKRTDVKSSNDRYANLETNYLLQRLESFTGICLLTSNHESHIDVAFQRRLSLHLRFELPDADQRAELWRAMLPAAAPVASTIDLASLGRRYAMSGGYIRNAALRAAFLAANDGTEIGAHHLERAARLEYEGMGKIASN